MLFKYGIRFFSSPKAGYKGAIHSAELDIRKSEIHGKKWEVHVPETNGSSIFYAERFDHIGSAEEAAQIGLNHALARGWFAGRAEAVRAMKAELERVNKGFEEPPETEEPDETVTEREGK